MMTILGVIIAIILIALSALHLYWAGGGKWGFDQALPKDKEGKRVLNPSRIDCVVVAFGLSLFAVYYLIQVGVIPIRLPVWLTTYGIWVISAIFALRALGDFKYIGFTKRITNTDFARLDTAYYSPLCALLTLGGIMIEMMK
jgi:hypothetical protein